MKKKKQTTDLNIGENQGISRRNFVTTTTLLGAALAVGQWSCARSSDHPKENKNRNDIASLVLKTRMQKKLMSN